MKYYHLLLFQLVLALLIFSCSPKGTINPVNLTCEYMTNPAVVDATSPRLSWINEASSRTKGCFPKRIPDYRRFIPKKLLKNEADLWDTENRVLRIPISSLTLVNLCDLPRIVGGKFWYGTKTIFLQHGVKLLTGEWTS